MHKTPVSPPRRLLIIKNPSLQSLLQSPNLTLTLSVHCPASNHKPQTCTTALTLEPPKPPLLSVPRPSSGLLLEEAAAEENNPDPVFFAADDTGAGLADSDADVDPVLRLVLRGAMLGGKRAGISSSGSTSESSLPEPSEPSSDVVARGSLPSFSLGLAAGLGTLLEMSRRAVG